MTTDEDIEVTDIEVGSDSTTGDDPGWRAGYDPAGDPDDLVVVPPKGDSPYSPEAYAKSDDLNDLRSQQWNVAMSTFGMLGLHGAARKSAQDDMVDELKELMRLNEERCQRRDVHRAGCSVRPCKECELASCEMCRADVPIGRIEMAKERRGELTNLRYDDDQPRRPFVRTLEHVRARSDHDEDFVFRAYLNQMRGMPRTLCDACAPRDLRRDILVPARSSVPEKYKWARFDAPELRARVATGRGDRQIRKAMEAVNEATVVLTGMAGLGKTTLAAAMFFELCDRAEKMDAPRALVELAVGAVWLDAFELNSALARWPLGKGDPPLLTQALDANLLVLDDLGGEAGVRQDAIREVIHRRHRDCLPTWLTTFLGPKEAAAAYGDGIARRLFEGARVISMTMAPASAA